MLDKAKKSIKKLKRFDAVGFSDIGYMHDITSSGLGFVFFENKSKDTQLTVALTFSEAKDTVFYPPIKDDRSEFVVAPGRQKIVVFRMVNPQSNFSYSQSVSFEKDISVHAANIKKHGQRQARLLNGKEVGIDLYVLKYSTGWGYYYENKTNNLELRELIEF